MQITRKLFKSWKDANQLTVLRSNAILEGDVHILCNVANITSYRAHHFRFTTNVSVKQYIKSTVTALTSIVERAVTATDQTTENLEMTYIYITRRSHHSQECKNPRWHCLFVVCTS